MRPLAPGTTAAAGGVADSSKPPPRVRAVSTMRAVRVRNSRFFTSRSFLCLGSLVHGGAPRATQTITVSFLSSCLRHDGGEDDVGTGVFAEPVVDELKRRTGAVRGRLPRRPVGQQARDG